MRPAAQAALDAHQVANFGVQSHIRTLVQVFRTSFTFAKKKWQKVSCFLSRGLRCAPLSPPSQEFASASPQRWTEAEKWSSGSRAQDSVGSRTQNSPLCRQYRQSTPLAAHLHTNPRAYISLFRATHTFDVNRGILPCRYACGQHKISFS